MVNEIIKTMGKQLGKKFPDCKIFADEVPQGFQEPCFQLEGTEIRIASIWEKGINLKIHLK